MKLFDQPGSEDQISLAGDGDPPFDVERVAKTQTPTVPVVAMGAA